MILLFILGFNLPVSERTFLKLDRISQKSTVLIYFFNENQPVSHEYAQIWTQFQKKYDNSTKIVFISANCSENRQFCRRFSIDQYPTYISIFQEHYKRINTIDKSLESIEYLIENAKPEPSFCADHFFNINKTQFPVFVIRSETENACCIVSKLKVLFPKMSNMFFHSNTSLHTPISYFESNTSRVDESVDRNPIYFVEDFSYEHFGNWSFSDVSHIYRRLVLIIYNDDISTSDVPKIDDFRREITSFQKYILFGKMKYSTFIKLAGDKLTNITDTPFIIATDRYKKKFMILDKELNKESLQAKLNSIRLGYAELEMRYYFDPNHNYLSGYRPKNTKEFALAAITTIAFTTILILVKAYPCIHYSRPIPNALRKR
ncbi:hypothetical protein TRFO_43139 [Tritrichomonas foetus]|uniref:Thioredoxin domain-containing protein n=1 Tax=Tritrichomonas foetus TaxID=1144522 RepID=A0A1J4KX08_9EUKA|nr:hypothetical protein TRFO_43139 [Tritrichomonas foetus]|eukprot:OHT14238.1 hypothetical protein TRFO_43139 [Tritrichomonas foetus]